MTKLKFALVGAVAMLAAPLAAQDSGDSATTSDAYEGTAYDGNYLSVGGGVVYGPSYDGSDDYEFTPVPLVQGRLGGVSINPRAGGVALDFIPDGDGPVNFNLGVAAKLNRSRASRIKDDVVELYGEKDTAIEVGPSVGVSFPAVLNPYDSVSINADVLWDVAGAHDGMTVNPSVTYFTPLSRGMAASLSASARYVDDDYADYYYSVPVLAADGTVGPLSPFAAEGGFDKVGVTALLGVDMDGDLTNGGLMLVALAGYSSMLNDGKRTPFTSVRGDADQWIVGAGIGYTF